jgi:hypothetical protein
MPLGRMRSRQLRLVMANDMAFLFLGWGFARLSRSLGGTHSTRVIRGLPALRQLPGFRLFNYLE